MVLATIELLPRHPAISQYPIEGEHMSFLGGGTPAAPPEEPTAPETAAEKKGTSKKDVTDLLKSFEPEAPATETAAQKERARRLVRWSTNIRQLATTFAELGGVDGSPADAAAALKTLQVVEKKGRAAIESLSDAKLIPTEAKPKKPAESKTLPAGTGAETPGGATIADDEKAREARQAERLAAAADERGAADPNAGDGF